MKNLKKLSRNELKKVNGGLMAPDGGCGISSWCANGSLWANLGTGDGNKEYCCSK